MARWCWINFQCPGILLTVMEVGQGSTVLAVGAGRGCLDIFPLVYLFSLLSPSLWETLVKPKTINRRVYIKVADIDTFNCVVQTYSGNRRSFVINNNTCFPSNLMLFRLVLHTRTSPMTFPGPEVIKRFSCSTQLSMKF